MTLITTDSRCRRRFRALVACAVSVFVTVSSSSFAQSTRTWDANGAAAGTGGTGTWDGTAARWFTGAAYVPWSNVTFDDAVFAGAAGTVTLSPLVATINAHRLTFGTTGYTVAGGTVTLGGANPTITASV